MPLFCIKCVVWVACDNTTLANSFVWSNSTCFLNVTIKKGQAKEICKFTPCYKFNATSQILILQSLKKKRRNKQRCNKHAYPLQNHRKKIAPTLALYQCIHQHIGWSVGCSTSTSTSSPKPSGHMTPITRSTVQWHTGWGQYIQCANPSNDNNVSRKLVMAYK